MTAMKIGSGYRTTRGSSKLKPFSTTSCNINNNAQRECSRLARNTV